MISLSSLNLLTIGLFTQTLNNRLAVHYGTIKAIQRMKSFFLVSNEDFIDITMRACMSFKIHCMGLNLKSRFLESIKRENKEFKGTIKKEPGARIKQIPLISGIKLKDYFLFDLASFSRQVAITQAEKLVFSFLACSSICSIKSWGKRIAFLSDLLFLLPVAIFIPKKYLLVCKHYTRSLNNKKGLTCDHTIKYSEHTPNKFIRLRKTIARSIRSTTSYLTQPLTEVMIMANRYDSAPLRAEQSKLFKFYDLSTTKVLETVANTEREARKNLGKQSLIFIARIRLYPIVERSRNWGDYSHE